MRYQIQTFALLISILSACTPTQMQWQSFTLPQSAPTFFRAQSDQIQIHLQLASRPDFSKKDLDTTQIKYVRLWVWGPGLANKRWNPQGFVKVDGNGELLLTIDKIPRGTNRIVTALGYDGNQNLIQGAILKASYSSLPNSSKVSVHLTWRYLPAVQILETLLIKGSPIAQSLNMSQLQALLDTLIYGGSTSNQPFITHPSLLPTSTIATWLENNNGKLPSTPPTTWNPVIPNKTFHVKTPQITPFNSPLTLILNDPASSPIVVSAGNDTIPLPALPPGTWNATVSISGLNNGVSAEIPVTVSPDGVATFQEGTQVSPLILPPVLSGLNKNAGTQWDTLTITGDGFAPVPTNNTVTVNNIDAPVIGGTATSLTISIPAVAVGATTIQVSTNGKKSNLANFEIKPFTQALGIPSYFYPGALWTQLENAFPAVKFAIINPNSGPGVAQDINYVNQVNSSRSKGVTILGYIHTTYETRLVAQVKAEIDQYYTWYNIDGIFIDEVSTNCAGQPYQTDLYNHIKSKPGKAVVVLNPGTQTNECYMSANDILVNFENDYINYTTTYNAPAWVNNYPPERFWHLVHNTPTVANMQNAVQLAKARRAGWIYITPDIMPNPWDTLPIDPYWSTELNDAISP